MKRIISLFTALAMLVINCTVFAATDIEGGKIIAEGVGASNQNAPMGYRAAQMDAYRNLVEQVNGVQVDAESTMENFMLTDDVVKTKVNGLIKGAVVVDKFRDNDGYYHIVMEIPVYGVGSLASAVFPVKDPVPFPEPEVIAPAPAVEAAPVVAPEPAPAPVVTTTTTVVTTTTTVAPTAPVPAAPAPAVAPAPAPVAEPVVQAAPAAQPVAPVATVPSVPAVAGNYTGVIVNCQGMDLQTAMAPAIFTPSHQVVYGLENFSNEVAVANGYVSYSRSLTDGVSRAGSNPLVVNATAIDKFCSPVISNEDAAKILAENKASGFLAQGKVVFVR